MRKNLIIPALVLFLAIAQASCKKEKLIGMYTGVAGNWEWVSGWPDNGSADLKLDLMEKGKYTLHRGSDKIDAGRLIEENGKLTFRSNKLFHKGFFTDEHQIIIIKSDTLCIGSNHISDFPTSVYVRR